jgi:hypothetical protein
LKLRGILSFALTAVGKIAIGNEAIKNIGMPAMTMRFATVRSLRQSHRRDLSQLRRYLKNDREHFQP